MNLVLDTHAFLWIVSDDKKLSRKTKKLFLNKSNDIYLSAASIWEMAIKISLGRLTLDEPLESFIETHAVGNNIKILDIKSKHLYKIENLPFHHRDPFDRIIIAQCMIENYFIVGSDKAFDSYPVSRVW
ncbi:MAG: type II toxin-antitoxin system VapC family toxin [Candidatus Dadabacteria bacterium]|nr:MAG: type II toxin-antitoxin system VapC family toxin [Candidatus Dadabacteria bacterium]